MNLRIYGVLALVAVLAAPTITQAATASTTNHFSLPLSYDDARAWYEANFAGVMKASNCRIVETRKDNQYVVETSTTLGNCRYILKKTREERTTKQSKAQTVYKLSYVRNVSGRIVAQNCVTTYTDDGDKTEVDVELTATISGRFIPAFAVRRDLSSSLAGAERYIVGNAKAETNK